jgi:hypothetical protein
MSCGGASQTLFELIAIFENIFGIKHEIRSTNHFGKAINTNLTYFFIAMGGRRSTIK